jgi:hypothetical protein
MKLIAATATVGAWVDASVPLSTKVIGALKKAGKVGVCRYVPLPNNRAGADIASDELEAICGAGLDLLLVQHVRAAAPGSTGWDPGAHDGGEDAEAAAVWACKVGYPVGAHLFLDLEDIAGTAAATITFASAWAAHICARGYAAGDYWGFRVPLGAEAAFDLPDFSIAWSDFGTRHIATRGFAIVQQAPEVVIAGTSFDRDVVAPDLLGNLPMVCRMGDP